MEKPNNLILVIFGASGDLTARKLIPAIYNLSKTKLLPQNFCILGVGRTEYSDEDYIKTVIFERNHLKGGEKASLEEFSKKVHYQSVDTTDITSYVKLKSRLEELDRTTGTNGNFIYYLSTPPSPDHPRYEN